MQKKALGRGLEALFERSASQKAEADPLTDSSPSGGHNDPVLRISIGQIIPNRYQPRTVFEDGELENLASSMKGQGVLQPILVRQAAMGQYELIAGERRWRAAKRAGLDRIPAIVRKVSDEQAVELALVENLQRQDLSPIEAARSYRMLIEEFGLTQEEVARRIGKDRSSVANTVRLLGLPLEVQQLVLSGKISHGHAKALLGISGAQAQIRMAGRIVRQGLSVRVVEEKTKKTAGARRPAASQTSQASQPLLEMQERLMRHLGTKVRINPDTKGGRISIQYHSDADLNRLFETITN